MTLKLKVLLGVTAVMLVLDQVSKVWIQQNLRVGKDEIHLIPNFLSVVHAKNNGAAFSSFDTFEYRMYLFAVFTVVAVGVLIQTFRQLRADDGMQSAAIGLILSGAIGNGIDRALHQEVTDWVRVYGGFEPAHSFLVKHFRTDTWPIWNVADACILIGVGLFAVHYLFEKDREEPVEGDAPPAL